VADRNPMTPYAKAAAYMGLALVTPASGWICYKIGQFLDRQMGTSWAALVGLIIGCAAGMYETYRQGLRIEGLSALVSKPPDPEPPKSDTPKPE
jgi:F0F1-type ATP synthase assembly protein I